MRPFPTSAPLPRQHGAALIEFALVLTILVSIVAGIVEFGRTFWYYDALSKATRNAARAVSVSNPATIGTVAAVAAQAAVNVAATSARVPNFNTSYVDVACADVNMIFGSCLDGTAPAAVRVRILDYPVLLGSQIPFLVGASNIYSLNLKPATTMPYMK